MPGQSERRRRLIKELQAHPDPIRGEDLARLLGVTRQVVVHEVALLRAAGIAVESTPRGYYLPSDQGPPHRTVLAVRHEPSQTHDELYAMVDHGLTVENVAVEHPVYGVLEGGLHLRSRSDVDQFLQAVRDHDAGLLSVLTQGCHLHTVSYYNSRDLDAAVEALRAKSIEVFD